MEQEELLVIRPKEDGMAVNERLEQVLAAALEGYAYRYIAKAEELPPLCRRRLLFVLDVGQQGINLEFYALLRKIRQQPDYLQGCIGGVLVDGQDELYTKSLGRELVFSANMVGCIFPGKPLVEGTGSLYNFTIQAQNQQVDLQRAYELASRQLVEKILQFTLIRKERPNLLVLHASNYRTSNTLLLWQRIKAYLGECNIQEIALRNGSVVDCSGCPYKMCKHFGENLDCYYGGVIVEEVYPAILNCDGLILLCPNYNDAISANLSAFINRLTALFNQVQFYDKYLFGLVVSGYSGGDIVAEQLLSSLSMNKTFILPARFAMLQTANGPGSIERLPDLEQRAEEFACNMLKHMKQ